MKHYGIIKDNEYLDFGYVDNNGRFQGNCFTPNGININESLDKGVFPVELILIPDEIIVAREVEANTKVVKATLAENAHKFLDDTDHELFKILEAQLAGEVSPYTPEAKTAFLAERKNARKTINDNEV